MPNRRKFLAFTLVGLTPYAATKSTQAHPTPISTWSKDFTRPKFWFGQEVLAKWEDDQGVVYLDRGLVIGMIFDPAGHYLPGWWYEIRWTHLYSSLWANGTEDGVHESKLENREAKGAKNPCPTI